MLKFQFSMLNAVKRVHVLRLQKFCAGSARCFSSGTNDSVVANKPLTPQNTEVLLYSGKYGKKMKWLRRVSLSSSLLSILFVPLSLTLESGLLPIFGQAAIAGTVLVTSMSSTALLAIVGHPYVVTLQEIIKSNPAVDSPTVVTTQSPAPVDTNIASGTKAERRFIATKLNIFGNKKITEFNMSEVGKDKNPFASFAVGKESFYIYGANVKDDEVRKIMTKEGAFSHEELAKKATK